MGQWDEAVFRALAEAVGDAVLILDANGVITCLHPSRPAVLANLAVGETLVDVLPEEIALIYRTAIQSIQTSGTTQTVNYQMTLDEFTHHFSARIVRPSESSDEQELIVVIRDVTGEVLAKQASKGSEEFYKLLAENASDIISVEDVEGNYLYLSPSVEGISGYRPEEVVGKNREDFTHPEDLERIRRKSPDGKLVPGPQGTRLRMRVRRKDGRWVWVESDVRWMKWQGKPALLVNSRDISRRKEAEQKSSVMLAELKEAQQRAEAANRAKSEFLAGISHDLRTPLHGLLGMAELLEQTHLSQEQQEYLAAIMESGDTLLARLNDLLDLSKIESGQLDLEIVDFNLVEAVESLTDILGSQAAVKGIQLFCHVLPEIPAVVRGDPHRLRQVLINLIGNAIKFTDRGEVDVRVTLHEGGEQRFSVRDTGIGMSAGVIDRVLGRSPQPSEYRYSRKMGTGVGLTISRQLVALMGGELRVDSSEGRGSTFYFDLHLPASDRAIAEEHFISLDGRRILATDENATNRQLIREILEKAGAEVELTSGGVETIRNLLDDPAYDCVILNASLPDLDGMDTAAMIRSNRTLEKLPLVLMISSAESDEVRRCKELKVNATLTKPVRRDVLLRSVQQIVTAGSLPEELTPKPGDGTILVVEDNEVNLRLARGILRRAGYGVVSARDGKEALKQLKENVIDAVLMDIQLPDMDGMEATARIRSTPAWSKIPIIAMTAHAMKGDAEDFLKGGVDDCLSKPVNQMELLGVLEREIAKRRDSSPARSED